MKIRNIFAFLIGCFFITNIYANDTPHEYNPMQLRFIKIEFTPANQNQRFKSASNFRLCLPEVEPGLEISLYNKDENNEDTKLIIDHKNLDTSISIISIPLYLAHILKDYKIKMDLQLTDGTIEETRAIETTVNKFAYVKWGDELVLKLRGFSLAEEDCLQELSDSLVKVGAVKIRSETKL